MIYALIFPHLIVWVSWYQNRKRSYAARNKGEMHFVDKPRGRISVGVHTGIPESGPVG
jgi:hypothetical protein